MDPVQGEDMCGAFQDIKSTILATPHLTSQQIKGIIKYRMKSYEKTVTASRQLAMFEVILDHKYQVVYNELVQEQATIGQALAIPPDFIPVGEIPSEMAIEVTYQEPQTPPPAAQESDPEE
ncbi:hypothetical protein ACFX1Q_047339 [Malus domestica]